MVKSTHFNKLASKRISLFIWSVLIIGISPGASSNMPQEWREISVSVKADGDLETSKSLTAEGVQSLDARSSKVMKYMGNLSYKELRKSLSEELLNL